MARKGRGKRRIHNSHVTHGRIHKTHRHDGTFNKGTVGKRTRKY